MLPAPVRVKFTKVGSLQFISHLDLNRTMKTVLVRAKIPIRYTEGFNPHPKMAFALPLSIGAESVCELLDFKIDEPLSFEEIRNRMNEALPPEMRVLEVYEPTTKFTDIAYAEYALESASPFSTEPLERDRLVVTKRTKSGEKEVDIKPLIGFWEKTGNRLTCRLCADSTRFLNPEALASALSLSDYTVMRKRLLLSDCETEFR